MDLSDIGYAAAGGIAAVAGWLMFSSYLSNRLKRLAAESERREQWYRSLYDNHRDGIIMFDGTLTIAGCNDAASVITGLNGKALYKRPMEKLAEMFPEDRREKMCKQLQYTLLSGGGSFEGVIVHPKGYRAHIEFTVVSIKNDGEQIGCYMLLKDITETKRELERAKELACKDELTGLPNRRKLHEWLEERVNRQEPEKERFAVMMLDIDQFKGINDTYGHACGDRFLREISERIRKAAEHRRAALARYGGDEFVLVLDGDEAAGAAAETAQQIVSALQFPLSLGDRKIQAEASIGIAFYPDHGHDAAELLRNADSAMYEVKRNGKNGFGVYKPESKRMEEVGAASRLK